MPYDVTLVQVADRVHGSCAIFTPFPEPLCGFPAIPFDFMLASMWVCLPGAGGGGSSAAFNFPFFTCQAISDNNTILVRLYDGTGAQIYSATYAAPLVGVRSNVILSVDSIAQVVQVYLNDAPLSVTVGGTWTGAGPFAVGAGSKANAWLFSYTGILFDPASADMWAAAPDSFVDLTIASNRRKFINADLTPVDLGASGSNPLGAQPPVFLTVPPAGVATDIQNNYGSGAAFSSLIGTPTITFETPGTCTLPPPPPGIPINLACGIGSLSTITPRWSPGDGATPDSYTLRYRALGSSIWIVIAGITDTFVEIAGLNASTTYEWQVQAVIGSLNSDWSNVAQCGTLAYPYQFLACDNRFTITQPIVKMYGFDHLIGMAVIGLADGVPIGPFTVAADGSVPLPFAASNAKIGLSYTAQIQTTNLDAGSPTVQGRRKNIIAVTARVEASQGIEVGTNQPDGAVQQPPKIAVPWTGMQLDPAMVTNTSVTPQTYLSPAGETVRKLYTGDLRSQVLSDWNVPGQVAVQQSGPLPLTLLAVVPELLEGDTVEAGYTQEKREHGQKQPRPPGVWMLSE